MEALELQQTADVTLGVDGYCFFVQDGDRERLVSRDGLRRLGIGCGLDDDWFLVSPFSSVEAIELK